MRYQPIPSSFFSQRRQELFKKLPPRSLTVILSNPPLFANGDNALPYKQNNNLYYLCGITQEKTNLILWKKSEEQCLAVLFLKDSDQKTLIWEGEFLDKKQAHHLSGIEKILLEKDFENYLHQYLLHSETIFLSIDQNFRAPVYHDAQKQLLTTLKKRYPLKSYKNIAPIIANMRTVKQPQEINAIKKAIDITGNALKNVTTFLKQARTQKKNIYEYQIEAILAQTAIANGTSFSFLPIVASGKNACTLHYIKNNEAINLDNSILIDVGVEYAYYNSDITRVFPVKKWSKRQREIYTSVDTIRKNTLKFLNDYFCSKKDPLPTLLVKEYQKQLKPFIEEQLKKLNLVKPSCSRKKMDEALATYLPHGVSHSLGLDVHDVEDTQTSERFLKKGMVITVEPGLYIREEGIGVRLEDDVLITDTGIEVLSKNIPTDVDEVQSLLL